jgi:hypothetical protein
VQQIEFFLLVLRVDALENLGGLVPAVVHTEPPGRVGHEQHADGQGQGGQHGEPEHRPPAPASRIEREVQRVGQQDAEGDGQLLQHHQAATDTRRGHLCDVGRDDQRRGPYRDTGDDPEGQERAQIPRERGQYGPGPIKDGQRDQRSAPAEPVGKPAADDAADDRADQDRGHGQLLGRAAEPEAAREQVLRPADHADVVPEQHPAQRGDRRHQVGVAGGAPESG